LLAGVFALAARPLLADGRWLKPLMMLWLGQNVVLTVSSAYRLQVYVEAYGLTYLRVYAGIWMALVAVWLCLIGWQIWQARANGWLVLRSFVMGGVVLYLSCFVNFAQAIAVYNLDHKRSDYWYACALGDLAAGARLGRIQYDTCAFTGPEIDGWRDWGFRKWRVASYIEANKGGSGQ
jgi:hypothetical protein